MQHSAGHRDTSKPSGQTVLLWSVLAASIVLVGYLVAFHESGPPPANAAETRSRLTLADIPFDGKRAYSYLFELCNLGPRPSGSPAMQAQQRLLSEHFQKLGGKVELQGFRVRHPLTGEPVPMANMIVRWHPERSERILLAAHYDTRPFPDQDADNPQGTFVGANDGASGTALLMELAHHMPSLKGRLGVDFVLFDGEEFVFGDAGSYFQGSEYFAMEHAKDRDRGPRHRSAVVLDMIADADLQIYQEINSMSWADTRPLVAAIWDTARRLGVREFVASRKFEIKDDHLALHNIAAIPCCDIIDFDYPYWHTEGDLPTRCSALSLAKVGWVMHEWLKKAAQK